MNPSFSSYLVNDVFGDPGVYVDIRWSKRALLFDVGHIDGLGPTRLLRVMTFRNGRLLRIETREYGF